MSNNSDVSFSEVHLEVIHAGSFLNVAVKFLLLFALQVSVSLAIKALCTRSHSWWPNQPLLTSLSSGQSTAHGYFISNVHPDWFTVSGFVECSCLTLILFEQDQQTWKGREVFESIWRHGHDWVSFIHLLSPRKTPVYTEFWKVLVMFSSICRLTEYVWMVICCKWPEP